MTTEVVAGWIGDGAAEAILAARRDEAAARHALARETLAGARAVRQALESRPETALAVV